MINNRSELYPRYDEAIRQLHTVVQDNWQATAKIDQWQEAKREGGLTALLICSDARITKTLLVGADQNVAEIQSISACGSMKPYKYMFEHSGFQQVIVLNHEPCGGVSAKSTQLPDQVHEPNSIEWYVDRKIRASNPSENSFKIGMEVSRYTNKSVLTGWVENQTGRIHPDYVIQEGKAINLLSEEIPASFSDFIASNKNIVEDREQSVEYEEFQESQLIQDPSYVLVSTSTIPLADKSKNLLVDPNRVFGITLPFMKQDGRVQITHIEEVVAQAEYPIQRAINAQEGTDFNSTRTIIIATPSLSISQSMAKHLMRRPVIDEWKKRRGGIILLNEIRSGIITAAGYM